MLPVLLELGPLRIGGYGFLWISLAMVAIAAAWFYLHRGSPPVPVTAAGKRRRRAS